MEKCNYHHNSCSNVLPVIFQQAQDQCFWTSDLENLFNHCNRNLFERYAEVKIPETELFTNPSLTGLHRFMDFYSMEINENSCLSGRNLLIFSPIYLKSLTHEMAHIGAEIYYGEVKGPRVAHVHGREFRRIAQAIGLPTSPEGVTEGVENPFIEIVLEKFAIDPDGYAYAPEPTPKIPLLPR